MLKNLSKYFHVDKSTMIKRSLFDLYENILDIETIESFERKEKKGKVSFTTAEDILEG